MKPKKSYGGQVIIEKEFNTEKDAQEWMARVAAAHESKDVHVEKHLWSGNWS